MRFGLVGTGHWARVTHGPALAREPGIDLVAVWGRSAAKAAALGHELGVASYTDFDRLLEQVDAVAFAVPPEVQAELGVRAADAGKHLLLEKPIATSVTDAERLVAAVDRAGVASVVFFTSRFTESTREWLTTVGKGHWDGAWARWIVSAFAPGSPYASSPWRHDKGALWDVGPHAVSLLTATLGPVVGVTAAAGAGDLVHLVLQHETGASSTVSLTLDAPSDAISVELTLWGPSGLSTLPRRDGDAREALGLALRELMSNIDTGGRAHPCDVHFGAAVVATLMQSQVQIAEARS